MVTTRSLSNGPHQKIYMTRQRKRNESKNCKDLISSLPDHILVHILSLLDLREAGRTSVLSKRWGSVWTNLSDLIFRPSTLSWWKEPNILHPNEADSLEFVSYVNKVVTSNCAPIINGFRISMRLGESCRADVIGWLDFAFGKSVKELELDLSFMGVIATALVYLDSFWCYAQYPSTHSLVSLSLVAVRISGQFLESVLSSFPNLERLTMKKLSCGGINIEVVGVLLKLRYLDITNCIGMGKVEISARNLTSFVYYGYDEVDVELNYVPLLSEASLGGSYYRRLIGNFHLISGFSSQLTKLTINALKIQDTIDGPIEFPCFRNLKELEFRFWSDRKRSLLAFTKFIDACPVLHKFKLKRVLFESSQSEARGANANKVAEKQHRCLKIFEMVGFLGAPPEFDLVLYLAKFAIVLEKVIFDPYDPCVARKPSECIPIVQIEAAREEAKLFLSQLPPTVQMELL